MSVSHWVRNGAFALGAVALLTILYSGLQDIGRHYVEGEEYAAAKTATKKKVTTDYIAQECLPLQSLNRDICIGNALDAEHETERSQRDLNAQQTMARVSVWMYLAAAIQALIGLGGIYYVARSLEKSAEAVTLTKQAMISENRPWVKVQVEPIRAVYLAGVVAMEASISIENVGKTPAVQVDVEYEIIDLLDDNILPQFHALIRKTVEAYRRDEYARHIVLPGDPFFEKGAADLAESALDSIRTDEDGVKYINPKLLVVVCYRSQFDSAVHCTAKAIDVTFESTVQPKRTLNDGSLYGPDDITLHVDLGSAVAT